MARNVAFQEILSHLGESYHPASFNIFHKHNYNTINQEKSKIYSLDEYLDLENGDYKFRSGDFYLSNEFISKYKLPTRPEKEKSISFEKNNGCLVLLSFVASIITLAVLHNSIGQKNSLILLLSLFSVIGIFYFFGVFKQERSKNVPNSDEENEKLINDFKSNIDVVKNLVRQDFTEYKIKKLKIVEKNREKVEKEIYRDSLRSTNKPIKINSTILKGRTELFFLEKLYLLFKNQISVDIIPSGYKNIYQPDFLFVCAKTGFHLVIEIDEPYSVENGKPIHHDRSNDNQRNEFFENLNWGLVRFSEKQIIESPNKCCEFIEKIMECIHFRTDTFKFDLDLDKKWNYEEALIMSNSNYRNTYLPENMKITIRPKLKNSEDKNHELPF